MSDIPVELLVESNIELVNLLREEIERDGPIPFARFMDQALAHPAHGYYARGEARPGFSGDFLTAPETNPIVGRALARQVAECWDRLDQPARFTLREEGAGAGTLARDIMAGLRDERPDALAALTYELGDVNPARVVDALDRLAAIGMGDHAIAAGDAPLVGLLLANELLDAFPAHRLVCQGGESRELYVAWNDGWFRDSVGPLSDPRLAEPFTELGLAEGQRVEVSLAAQEWARDACAGIERGYAILIDYGYPATELYSRQRFDGTLRAYSRHDVSDDPYRRIGTQDLTAHVDFTAISRAAREGGCAELGLTSQAFFFAGLGIEELLLNMQETDIDPVEYLRARETVLRLMEPGGLGRFRVLGLGKGVEADPPLRGFAFTLR